jgi:ATP-dependent Lhr-like helicase
VWESELLPARLDPYQTSWLDTLLQETDLRWVGVGRERVTFAFPEDLPLLVGSGANSGNGEVDPTVPLIDPDAGEDGEAPPESGSTEAEGVIDPVALFPGPGRFTLPELLPHSGRDSATLSNQLWGAAWEGRVTNDSFAAVRKGVLNRFKPAAVAAERGIGGAPSGLHRPRGRHGFDRWQASRAFTGRWYPLPASTPAADPLEQEERRQEAARLVLQRYGVVFRELLARELPALSWRQVFRSLRLMELGGEVAAGAFFHGIPGLQFASPAAVRRLRRELPLDAVWWVSALDPASPCGLALPELRGVFPRRIAGTHVVFQGSQLVMSSEARGRRLRFEVGPDHPRLVDYLEPLRVQLTRSFAPVRSIEVQEINGEPAVESPFAAALAARFQVTSTASGLRLWRRY